MAIFPTLSLNPTFDLPKEWEDSVLSSSFEGGYVQSRPRWTRDRRKWSVQYKLVPMSDVLLLEKFFKTVRNGADKFWWPHPILSSEPSIIWQPNTAYAVDDIVRPTTQNGRSYRCTVAGTTGATQPTWPTTEGQTVVDVGATWKENSYDVRFKGSPKITPEFFSDNTYRHNIEFELEEV